jgi:hypothetical protein
MYSQLQSKKTRLLICKSTSTLISPHRTQFYLFKMVNSVSKFPWVCIFFKLRSNNINIKLAFKNVVGLSVSSTVVKNNFCVAKVLMHNDHNQYSSKVRNVTSMGILDFACFNLCCRVLCINNSKNDLLIPKINSKVIVKT